MGSDKLSIVTLQKTEEPAQGLVLFGQRSIIHQSSYLVLFGNAGGTTEARQSRANNFMLITQAPRFQLSIHLTGTPLPLSEMPTSSPLTPGKHSWLVINITLHRRSLSSLFETSCWGFCLFVLFCFPSPGLMRTVTMIHLDQGPWTFLHLPSSALCSS